MAHPHHHALSSVRKWGGCAEEYQRIHDWFDESKKIIADFRHRGLTVLLVEQNANAALAIADRGYVLETGRVTISARGEELLSDPRVRAAYLGV